MSNDEQLERFQAIETAARALLEADEYVVALDQVGAPVEQQQAAVHRYVGALDALRAALHQSP